LGFTQHPDFRHVANFNIGLYCQQAGLTLSETLTISGIVARLESSNARPNQPYGLDPQNTYFISEGYRVGASGVFGPGNTP
jgi:hypothetical protein